MRGGTRQSPQGRARGWGRRTLWLLVPGIVVYYLVFGGAYSVFDLRELHRRRAEALRRVDSLQSVVDSLALRADSLVRDTLAIERLARERYGFIRDGEILYRFLPPREEQEETAGVDRSERHR